MSADAPDGDYRHATCVLVGEDGVLIVGPSGSGKSTLAREIVALAAAGAAFSRLVGDDRVSLSARGGRLVARAHPLIAGQIEIRGLGLRHVAHAGCAVIRLLVNCGPARLDRLPETDHLSVRLLGVPLRRIVAHPGEADRVLLALEDVRRFAREAGSGGHDIVL